MSCELCELKRRITELEADNSRLKDQLLRALAARDNIRRAVIQVVNGE